MTARQFISNVRSTHKLLSTDSLLNDRSILAEGKSVNKLLVKRETDKRKLWASDTIFTTISCLEMVEVPISECCDYVDNCTISRSVFKIPKIAIGNYQYVIQGVYSINAMGGKGKRLKEITINRYINLLKLPIIKKEEYYWIVNNYLYCSNPLIKSLRITAFFEEDIPLNIMYPECDCGPKSNNDEICKNPLDLDIPIPGYLEKQVLDLTSQRLLTTFFKLRTDQTTDNVDGQSPNTQPTQ